MKMTPVAGPVLPSADVGSGSSVSPERREAARRAYNNPEGVTVTQVEKPEDIEALAEALNTRSPRVIKMKTNHTTASTKWENPTEEVPVETKETPGESALSSPSETVDPEVSRPISPQFAALAKQKRALQVMEQQLAAREKALEEKSQSATGIDPEELKRNPLEVLKREGVTYDLLTEHLLGEQSGVTPEIRALQEEIKALREGVDTKFSERDSQTEQQVLAELARDAKRLVESNPEEYELIAGTGSEKKVTELIHRIFKKTGEVLDVAEAAKLIEDQLVEDSLKATSFNKIRSKLTPTETTQVDQPAKPGIRTLTNRDTAQRVQSRRDRAIGAFFGKLK